jgi:D-aminopeptidase
MKRVWDFDELAVYECQTNSMSEKINKCVEKATKLGVDMVFVTNSEETAKSIQESMHLSCIVLQ